MTTVASASITGTAGNLYLASISTRANVAVSSVSGLSLTWTRVAAQCGDQGGTRVEVWKGTGTPSASGAVTATLASAPTAAAIAVSRYSGASGTGNTIAANGLGTNGACTGGTTSTSYTANVTTAVANATVYGASAIRSSTHTPGSGYTERAEKIQGTGTSAAGTATEDKTVATAGSTAVNGTLSAATDWAVIGVEVRP